MQSKNLTQASSIVSALPEPSSPHKYKPTKSTCPASTPFTTIYVTSSPTVITVTSYVYQTFPTTATLPRSCPTFTTIVDHPNPATSCKFNASTCTVLECLAISTITKPCNTDSCCPSTIPTSTLYQDCPTACPTGCGGTSWTAIQPPCPTVAPSPPA